MKIITKKIKELEKEFEEVKKQAVIREKELKVLMRRMAEIQAQFAVLDELRKSKK
jgi:hypothetical protein